MHWNRRYFHVTALCVMALALAVAAAPSHADAQGATGSSRVVASGTNWLVDHSTQLASLTLAQGGQLSAPEEHSLTLTVNGAETAIRPGTYAGKVVLTVTDSNIVRFAGMGGSPDLLHPFREALFLDRSGVVTGKSVLPAAGAYTLKDGILSGARIKSVGENFNGIYVTGGTYTIKDANVDLTGNGGNDFAGFGAGIMATGKDTTLIVDRARIRTHGAVRTAIVADKGSHLIVKDSDILARNGTLPADYVSNVTPGQMKDVPWMLGLAGNCRATNLLGDNTTATYINSAIAAEGWGVLSVDSSTNTKLTAINSTITITGRSGYGSYSIGNALNSFYGSALKVASYGVIITGGNALFAASTPARIAKLNTDLHLGLTAAELKALPQRPTTVDSGRFGVMWHGPGTVKVLDDTVIKAQKTIFLVKGASADINVDGARGAQLNSKSGVIIQLIDNDDPGPVMVSGTQVNKGVYHESKSPPARIKGFDLAAAHGTDVTATFANINIRGDFYNAFRGDTKGGPGGPPSGPPGGPPGGGPGKAPAGKNLVLAFEHSGVAGVITASSARHAKDTITAADYQLLGDVTNTAGAAINNGVSVTLKQSTWTLTGNSYLTALNIGEGSALGAPPGFRVAMSVDDRIEPIKPGMYRGRIVLTVSKT